jgi:probable phosphoglycerate mutase
MKHLYFMRHGLSEMNKRGLFSGRIDTPLAKEGIVQCQEAGHAFRGTKVDLMVSSPMMRAFESAKIVAGEIDYPEDRIILSELLMERDLGSLEGSNYIKGLPLNRYDGVEHSDNLIERAKQALEFLNNLQADSILIVSHGAIGRAIKYVIDPSLDFNHITGFANADIIKLV